jgi:succinoglycan biosynthesis transport protein ExoP
MLESPGKANLVNETISARGSDFELVLRVLRRRRLLIVGCALLATAATLGFSLVAKKQYSASATLLFLPSEPNQALNSSNPPPPALSASDQATNEKLVGLSGISQATAAALTPQFKRLTPGTVKRDVSVAGEGTSNLVDIVATTPDPELSAAIANTYAQQFIAARVLAARAAYAQAQQLVQAQLNHPASLSPLELRTLQAQAQQLRLLRVMQTGNTQFAQRAQVPGGPSSPLVKRNTVLGLVLGLVIGFALALLLERLDRRIKDVDDLEATLQLPVLGIVPESRAFDDWTSPGLHLREEEAFRMLRTRLRYFNVDRDIRSLLVVSAAPNDGKSTIAYHLARAAANTGGARVVLVEADLRKPHFASRTGLEALPGLAELLTENLTIEDVTQKLPIGVDTALRDDERTLDLIVAGTRPPNPSELIESQKMSQLLGRLHEEYDLVVIDTPPTAVVADAIPLLGQVDGVLIVTRLNRSTKTGVTRLREQLKNLGAPMLGVVANHFMAERGYDYGYGYGDGYYSGGEPSKRRLRSRNVSRSPNGKLSVPVAGEADAPDSPTVHR